MKLSIVIVNYNVKYFLGQCLVSVKRAIEKIDAEVLVVDNASTDGSCELIRAGFPWVRLIQSEKNLGFSKANNAAIKLASGEYVLLLNPDTFVAEDTFEKCIAFMDMHPEAGALGARMIDGKGNFLPESKRGLPTPAVAFYKTFGLASLFPRSKVFGKYHLGFLPKNEVHEVDILSGAFMFIRKKALDKTGLLDESFFMYGEDVDLSYRIIQSGYKNYYFPETTIVHYKGESTKKGSLNYVKVFYNAMILFARKHFSGNQSGLFSFVINLAIFFRGILTVLANLFSSSSLFIIDALLSFSGIFFIKTYWENMIKYTDHYYPNQFLFIVVPIYIIIWIISAFLTGGYDKPYRVSNIIRGIFFGTLAIAAVYAFLPNEWRFSRAIIILGAIWTTFEMLFTRTIYHLIRYQSLSIENNEEKRTLLAGGEIESNRAKKLLVEARAESEIISTVSDMHELKKFVQIFNINEIIFCAHDFSFSEIISGITTCGNQLEYKILNEGSDAFIGSNSKNSAGDLYSRTHNLNLAKATNQRKKRMFDLLTSVLFVLLLPLNVFIIPRFGNFFNNLVQVMMGKSTWVGYSPGGTEHLPPLRPGIISGSTNLGGLNPDQDTLSKLNFLYAKHYSVSRDIELLWKNFRKLGE